MRAFPWQQKKRYNISMENLAIEKSEGRSAFSMMNRNKAVRIDKIVIEINRLKRQFWK